MMFVAISSRYSSWWAAILEHGARAFASLKVTVSILMNVFVPN
jgi:hypothetical protein